MTWLSIRAVVMAMGLLYMLALWSNVYYTKLWIHWFHDHGATISNGSVTIRRTSLVGVGHSKSDLIVPLMRHIVYCVMVGALALYYKALGTEPTMLRMGTILGRPYC
jgi:hypothetical protein